MQEITRGTNNNECAHRARGPVKRVTDDIRMSYAMAAAVAAAPSITFDNFVSFSLFHLYLLS